MTDLRQAAQQALEAYESTNLDMHIAAITALKAALEQQAEPSMWGSGDGYWILAEDKPARPDKELFNIPFYTAPPQQQAEPVMLNGLTEAETNAAASVMGLTKQADPDCEHCYGSGKTIVYGIAESWEENCLYCNGTGITQKANT